MNGKKLLSTILIAIFALAVMPLSNSKMWAHATCPNGILNNGLGGISININAAPYTDAIWAQTGGAPYGTKGCTWFVGARVKQLTGKNTICKNPSDWYYSYGRELGFSVGETYPTGKAVIVYSGHVAILEKTDGNKAYVSEGGNTSVSSAYGHATIKEVDKYSLSKSNGVIGFVYLTNSNIAPTIANVSTAKTLYAVDEKVTFNISADGDTTNLWIYCPNGQTLTYKNVGATYTVGFGMSGYYEGLVETWNGKGSKKSSRISWRVGKPTICNLSIAKYKYAVDEKVTFNMKVDGTKTNLWIYCPNGQTLTYKDVGATYTVGFGMSGHYEALAETWNGIGSKQSARVSWDVGTVTPTDTQPPTIKNAKVVTQNKDTVVIEADITDNVGVSFVAHSVWNAYGQYANDGIVLIYGDHFNQEWISSTKVRFALKYKPVTENNFLRIQATDAAGNNSYAKVPFTTEAIKYLYMKVGETKKVSDVWSSLNSTDKYRDKSYYNDVITYSNNTFTAKKPGRATLVYRSSDGTSVYAVEVVVSCATHSWDGGKVTKQATETTTGVKTYTCKVCKETKTESIPKLPASAKPASKPSQSAVAPVGKAVILNTIANSAKRQNDVIWDKSKVRNANRYEISWKKRGASKWATKTIGNTVRGTTTGLSIKGLYEIRVRPKSVSGKYGAYSNTVYRYFHTTEKIRLSSKGRGSFTMSWKRNPEATSYQVMFTTNKNGSGAAKNINTVGANATSFTKKGLKSGVTYYVQVREVKRVGNINYIGNISCPVAVRVK